MCIYQASAASSAWNDPHRPDRELTYNSEAHVITQGLGQNEDVFPPGMVCDDCNRHFGKRLEPALIRHPTLAYDMQRLGVPGKDGGPRQILGNWRRGSDGSVLVPMAPPQDWGQHQGAPFVGVLPILDPEFDQLRFRRGLHLLAFNRLAYLNATGGVPLDDAANDSAHVMYDVVRRYIRFPKRPDEAWPFLERFDPAAAGMQVQVRLFKSTNGMIVRIRAYSFEFYVDLLNAGNLLAFAEAEGITRVRLIEPGVRYPASPTMDEVPPEERWWLRFYNGQIEVIDPRRAEGYLFTPVGKPTPIWAGGPIPES